MFCCFRCYSLYLRWGIYVPVYQSVVTLFVVLNFSLATFMDPGVIPKGKTHVYFPFYYWNVTYVPAE